MSAARVKPRASRPPIAPGDAGKRSSEYPGPGAVVSAGPLGLDDPLPWEDLHPRAPVTGLVDAAAPPAQGLSAFERIPTSIGARSLATTQSHAAAPQIQGALAPAEASPAQQQAPPADQDNQPAPKKSSAIASFIRDRLTPEGLGELKAMMFDPKLALTVAQRDIVSRIGRYAELGDKSGIKRSVLDLVEKVDVTSPKNATVIVQQSLGQEASASVTQALSALENKKSLNMTQGGRALDMLAPILQQNGAFEWKDGMDRGWQRLNERFAHQAQGQVDVVVSPQVAQAAAASASGPANAPIGQWAAAPSGAAPGAAPPTAQVGVWNTAAPAPGSPQPSQVGVWSAPPSAPGSPPPAGVGSWSVSSDASAAPGGAPPGQWTVPKDAAGQSAAKAASVGQWNMPDDAGGSSAAKAVGEWNVPTGPAKADAAAPAGQWSVPRGGNDAASPTGGAVGQWSTAAPASDAAPKSVGAWNVPAGGQQPAAAAVGRWSAPDVAITDAMKLSDLVRSNPNISAVRFVQMAAPPGQPGGLSEILNIGSNLLRQHFGG